MLTKNENGKISEALIIHVHVATTPIWNEARPSAACAWCVDRRKTVNGAVLYYPLESQSKPLTYGIMYTNIWHPR
jgi:hypothetical protein